MLKWNLRIFLCRTKLIKKIIKTKIKQFFKRDQAINKNKMNKVIKNKNFLRIIRIKMNKK